jgi:hypothetical protein
LTLLLIEFENPNLKFITKQVIPYSPISKPLRGQTATLAAPMTHSAIITAKTARAWRSHKNKDTGSAAAIRHEDVDEPAV